MEKVRITLKRGIGFTAMRGDGTTYEVQVKTIEGQVAEDNPDLDTLNIGVFTAITHDRDGSAMEHLIGDRFLTTFDEIVAGVRAEAPETSAATAYGYASEKLAAWDNRVGARVTLNRANIDAMQVLP